MQEDESQIPTFPSLVMNYFPKAVRETYSADVPGHMLRKAIGMTVTLTEVITDAGSAFFPMMMDLTGANPARIAGAWLEGMRLAGAQEMKAALAAAKARPQGAHAAWTALTEGVEQLVASWLAPGSEGYGAEDRVRLATAVASLASCRSLADGASAGRAVEAHVAAGIPRELAEHIVNAAAVVLASEVCAVASARSESIEKAAQRYTVVGLASKLLGPVRGQGGRRADGRWDPVARGILRLRYQRLLRDLVMTVEVPDAQLSLGVDRCAEALGSGPLAKVGRVVDQILGESPDVAALLVAEQQIRAAM
jgi:glutamate dehydrogenase